MIDAHIHADTRPYEDFEKMAVAGIRSAITCAHDPLNMSTAEVVLDHFHRLLGNDISRAEENGLKLLLALGIHPRSISKDYKKVFEKLPNLLENEFIVAIGEIGLEKATKLEIKIFKLQLSLAETLNMKCIVHTPRVNKREITKITVKIIEENIDPAKVVIDHVDKTVITDLIDFGAMLGLTVQPMKMNPEEAVSIIREYGSRKFILNSDISSSPSDPLSVPKTVHKMNLAGFNLKDIRRVSSENAAEFFKI